MCLGIPGRIEEVFTENGAPMAMADFVGERRKVCLSYLPDLTVGEYTIVHAGYALTRLDEAEAAKTIATMREVGLLGDTDEQSQQSAADFVAAQREPDVTAAALLLARARTDGHDVAVAASDPTLVAASLLDDLVVVPGPGAVTGIVDPADVGALRDWARPGSLLLLACEDADAHSDLLTRCGAWGVTVLVVCSGRRPAAGLASAVLERADRPQLRVTIASIVNEAASLAAQQWLMERPTEECAADVCVTCSDEGRIAEVQRIPAGDYEPAVVRTATGNEEVDVTCVAPVAVGDLIIVHAGSAIGRSSGYLQEAT